MLQAVCATCRTASAPPPASAASPVAGASPAPAAGAPRPALRPEASPAERDFCQVQWEFLRYLQGEESRPPAGRVETLRGLLQRSVRLVEAADRAALGGDLYSFKFPVRRMAEELERLSPGALEGEFPGKLTARGYVYPDPGFTRWDFDALEEAAYQFIFHDPEKVDPVWAMHTLMLEHVANRGELMPQIIRKYGMEATKVDMVRQLLTGYVSLAGGRDQFQVALRVIDPDRLEGCTWAEIGYGSGKIFTSVRQALGPKGRILAEEVGWGYEEFGRRAMERPALGWGQVTFFQGSTTDCALPANSVDIVHEAGVHVGVEGWAPLAEQIAWARTIRRALRPGGLMVLDDYGGPPLDQVRKVMGPAGFREHRIAYRTSGGGGDRPPAFVVSYQKPPAP